MDYFDSKFHEIGSDWRVGKQNLAAFASSVVEVGLANALLRLTGRCFPRNTTATKVGFAF